MEKINMTVNNSYCEADLFNNIQQISSLSNAESNSVRMGRGMDEIIEI